MKIVDVHIPVLEILDPTIVNAQLTINYLMTKGHVKVYIYIIANIK